MMAHACLLRPRGCYKPKIMKRWALLGLTPALSIGEGVSVKLW